MTQFIQCHFLTFYPPSNANRDDIGRPKTANVGGKQRLRLSSQSIKRAVRMSAEFAQTIETAYRSRNFLKLAFDKLSIKEEAQRLSLEKTMKENFGIASNVLAFLSKKEIENIESILAQLANGTIKPENLKQTEVLLLQCLAPDIAMFGRMMADAPSFNINAACQIAHAFTTNAAEVEDDYFTAVDDLNTNEETGAGFLSSLGFGSGIFYLYACIDFNLLLKNLGGNRELAETSVLALIKSLATTGPTGKINSFANRVRAEYILVETGSNQPRSLANAFIKPIMGDNILEKSITALQETKKKLDTAYEIHYDKCIKLNCLTPDQSDVANLTALTNRIFA